MKFHNINPLNMFSSKTKHKIVNFMLTSPAVMSEREIASILKISPMSVNRTMKELAELNFVNYTTIGKAHTWKVNRKSYFFKIISQLIDKKLSADTPLQNLKQTLMKYIPKTLVKRIILFGSISKGVEKTHSDIDIFILAKDNEAKTKIEPYIERLVNVCLETYGNRLSAYVLTNQELKNKRDLNITAEINTGIEIFPGEEGKK